MENRDPDACLVSAWEENKRNALSHYLRRTFESFHRNFTFYLGLRYCGDLVLLIQDSTKSLIPRGRRRALLCETRGTKQANFEIQRKTILTSHIFLHLHDFLTQVSILHCENKKTLLVYKSNQKNSKLNDKKQRRTGAILPVPRLGHSWQSVPHAFPAVQQHSLFRTCIIFFVTASHMLSVTTAKQSPFLVSVN